MLETSVVRNVVVEGLVETSGDELSKRLLVEAVRELIVESELEEVGEVEDLEELVDVKVAVEVEGVVGEVSVEDVKGTAE